MRTHLIASALLLSVIPLLNPQVSHASLIGEDFLALPAFSVTKKGKATVEGEMGMKVWRADSWDADSSFQLETAADPDRLFRRVLRLTNLGPVASGVLWLPKQQLTAGNYRLEVRYRTFDGLWAVLDLQVDQPEEAFEIIGSSRVASAKPIDGKTGRKFTLLPTNGKELTFTSDFSLKTPAGISLVIGHPGIGPEKSLLLSGIEISPIDK